MKKGLLMLLSGLMVLGAVSNAMAGARLDSMGADVRQFDNQDIIWLYPSEALLYTNTVDFRLNGNDNGSSYFGTANNDYNEWGGVLKDISGIGTLGLYVNRPESLGSGYYSYQDYWGQYTARDWVDSTLYGQPFTPVGGVMDWSNNLGIGYRPSNGLQPENLADVFWANTISGINLGAVVNYGDYQRWEQNGSDDARSLGINASAGFGAVGPFSSLSAHLGYQMGSLNNPSNNLKDNGIYTIPFGVMGDISMGTDTSLRTFVDGQWNQFSMKQISTGDSQKDANNHYLAGAAINQKISGGKGLVSAGLFYAYGDWEYSNSLNSNKTDSAYWDVIANIGVDTPVASWLNWRAGITKMVFERWYSKTTGNAAYYGDDWTMGSNYGAGYSSFNTGFGVNVENWTLDTNLSVGELEAALGDPSLGNILFGQSSGNNSYPLFEVVTLDAKYKF